MANMHLVTGYAGKEHVTSADHGVFNSYLFGTDQFVFDRGNKLAANIESNNLIRVLDGDIYIQGRHVRLNEGKYVDLAIENGEQGMLRNDLIAARYTKNSGTGVEDCNLVVIKGTAAASNPADPQYSIGDIINGNALQNDMPLYRVPLNGLNVGELVPLFTLKEDKAIQDKQDRTNDLTVESTLEDGDAFPFFDASGNAHRKTLWSTIKKFFALAKHEHGAGDITSGIIPIERGGTGVGSVTELASALSAALIETGNSSGTNSSVTLTFSFKPKVIIIESYKPSNGSYDTNAFVIATDYNFPQRLGIRQTSGSAEAFLPKITFSGNAVSIDNYSYITGSGFTFAYVALG